MRAQIMVYKAQHRDTPPGYPNGDINATPDAATFVSQMTGFTDETGNVSPVQRSVSLWAVSEPDAEQSVQQPICLAAGDRHIDACAR